MKKSRFADRQIMDALKRAEAGFKIPDLCRELGISSALFYRWRAKFGGIDASMTSRMKELEEENRRLDFMHQTLYDRQKFRLLNVIDEGNREALRIECGSSIPSTRFLRVLDELIDFYGKPKAIRMDNGPEMTSAKIVSWAEQHGIELRYIQPGKPNQNAFVERFNRSVR